MATPFVTADQLFAHLVGDYVLQSDWMAQGKVRSWAIATYHALTYAVPFYVLTQPSWTALWVIIWTHALIDRYRLARYLVWAKNRLFAPGETGLPWADCAKTGFAPDRPEWLAVWLLIITDNILHLGINALALRYL